METHNNPTKSLISCVNTTEFRLQKLLNLLYKLYIYQEDIKIALAYMVSMQIKTSEQKT